MCHDCNHHKSGRLLSNLRRPQNRDRPGKKTVIYLSEKTIYSQKYLTNIFILRGRGNRETYRGRRTLEINNKV